MPQCSIDHPACGYQEHTRANFLSNCLIGFESAHFRLAEQPQGLAGSLPGPCRNRVHQCQCVTTSDQNPLVKRSIDIQEELRQILSREFLGTFQQVLADSLLAIVRLNVDEHQILRRTTYGHAQAIDGGAPCLNLQRTVVFRVVAELLDELPDVQHADRTVLEPFNGLRCVYHVAMLVRHPFGNRFFWADHCYIGDIVQLLHQGARALPVRYGDVDEPGDDLFLDLSAFLVLRTPVLVDQPVEIRCSFDDVGNQTRTPNVVIERNLPGFCERAVQQGVEAIRVESGGPDGLTVIKGHQ